MKKLFSDFKKFISKGNVIDLAVGMIIGAAFTAIVTALVNYIFKPLIAAIPGADGTSALKVTLRQAVYDSAGNLTSEAVVLDFGEVISAVITFLLTAIILFAIVKVIVAFRERSEKLQASIKKAREDKLRAEGKLPPLPEEQPAEPEEIKPTTEELLAQIRDLLAMQNAQNNTEKAKQAENAEG